MALVSAFAEVLQRGDACTPTLPLCRDAAGRQAPVRPASAAMKGDNGKLNDVVPPELQPVQRRPRRSNWLRGGVHVAAGKVCARDTRDVGIIGNVPWRRADVKVAMARTHRRARSSAPARSSPVALHTAATLEAKTVLPIKGMWFETLDKLNDWLASLSGTSATQFAQRVIKVNFSQGSDKESPVARYFVMTGVTAFVQSYCGISHRPNAKILFDPERPLGQYSLKIELLQKLAVDREIVISKGVDHTTPGRPKEKRIKATKV